MFSEGLAAETQETPPRDLLGLDTNENAWKNILQDVQDVMQNTSTPGWTLLEGHPLRARIAALVPWDLQRVQAYRTPKQRRMPTDIPYTLRATIGLCGDDTLLLEAERTSGVAFPKQRFSKAVSVALFIYGNPAPGTDQAPAAPAGDPIDEPGANADGEGPAEESWAPPVRPKGSRHNDEIC